MSKACLASPSPGHKLLVYNTNGREPYLDASKTPLTYLARARREAQTPVSVQR